jgi:phage tail-like protein
MSSQVTESAAAPGEALAAARFSISIDGVEIAQFSELVELKSGLDPSALSLGLDPKRKLVLKKLPGKRPPPTVTLKRGMTGDLGIAAWHSDAAGGRAEARRNAELAFYGAQGETVARYYLESAWPSLVEISGVKSGGTQILLETVTLVCENVERVAP